MKIDEYIDFAMQNGALHVVKFGIDDIVFDERSLLKCAFGCSDWGLSHTCPSADSFLGIDMYKRIFSKYKTGLIVHTNNKQLSQDISFSIESKAYTDGFYWAFSLSDCALCKDGCSAKTTKINSDKPELCRFKRKARPSFHSVGIDVFATVHKFNLPLFTLPEGSTEQNWYSAIFIE